MGKRGPKPVNIGLLHMWEFEWFKALHLLRDGKQLPGPEGPTVDPASADARVRVLERMPLPKVVGEDPPSPDWQPTKAGDRADLATWNEWAERVRHQAIAETLAMKPKEIFARVERRQIWDALWRAKNAPALSRACERWKSLPDVQASGMSVFADHVLANAKGFLAITRSSRFPKSAAADDSRLDSLARGMAGAMAGVSPLTGIERLRNMRHDSRGPFWFKKGRYCRCWRCEQRNWEEEQLPAIQAALQAAELDEDL